MNTKSLSNNDRFNEMESRIQILEEKVESLAKFIDELTKVNKTEKGVPPDEYFAPIRQAKVFAYE